MRDLWLVNLALLAKWRWNFLIEDSCLWREILISIYEATILSFLSWGSIEGLHFSSSEWKRVFYFGLKRMIVHIGLLIVSLGTLDRVLRLPFGRTLG